MKKKSAILALLFAVVFAVTACGSSKSTASEETTTEEPTTITVEETVVDAITAAPDAAGFAVYDLGDSVSIHTPLQQAVLLDEPDNCKLYADGQEELGHPEGVNIKWTYAGEAPEQFTVSLSTNSDMSSAKIYAVPAETDEYGIYTCNVTNLYLMQTYYYTIEANGAVSDVYTFTTDDAAPRNMYVDGVANVRDLGGWATADGGHVRQGMIYRGGRLSEDEGTAPEVTETGMDTLLNEMGIKTEIDYRNDDDNENGGLTASVLGDSVNYVPLPWVLADGIPEAADVFKETFVLLSDESNYPVYFHCSIGTDRTGYVAFLIGALLGVSEEDLYHDYIFSNLGSINGHRSLSNITGHIDKNVKVCEGDTLQEQTYNYLLGVGVTAEQLDQVIAILTVK